ARNTNHAVQARKKTTYDVSRTPTRNAPLWWSMTSTRATARRTHGWSESPASKGAVTTTRLTTIAPNAATIGVEVDALAHRPIAQKRAEHRTAPIQAPASAPQSGAAPRLATTSPYANAVAHRIASNVS